MSLKTVLISLIVAGVLAGLVLVSQSVGSLESDVAGLKVRGIGIDGVSIVEVRVESGEAGTQIARRIAGALDSWELQLSEDEIDVWKGDATRIRTVLRALGSASLSVVDDGEIGDVYGVLTVVDRDERSTEIRFESEASGGFVRAEIVSRGLDGIATGRWFGRIERSLRDSLLADGIENWRAMGLFDFTQSQVIGAEVGAGDDVVGLRRGEDGWSVIEPWSSKADPGMVQSMLGLTLGLVAERFYDETMYTDDLTGLGSPMARIRIAGRESEATIEIGAAVDSSGSEIFARYRIGDAKAVLVAIKTEGLNRLTPAPLAYVHATASVMGKADVSGVRILGTDGQERFACEARLESWEVDGVVVSASQRKAIDRLIQVLIREKAGRILKIEEGDDSSATLIGGIELIDQEGETESFGVWLQSTDGGVLLHLSQEVEEGGSLVWVCSSAEAGGTGAWVGTLAAGDTE